MQISAAHEWLDLPLASVKFFEEGEAAKGTFTGYASVFGNVDLGGDIIERGAFRDTLAKRGASDVLMLWGHNSRDVPIGKWHSLEEDDKGLRAVGQLELGLAKAREVHTAMSAGLVKGLSIGFLTKAEHMEWDDHRKVRRIKTVSDLLEVSVVNIPMNQRARISNVKSAIEEANDFPEIERVLRDAGFSRTEAPAIIARVKAIAAQRDSEDEKAGVAAWIKASAARHLNLNL